MRRRKHAAGGNSFRRVWLLLVFTSGLLLVLAGAAYAGFRYEQGAAGRLLPGIRIAGIDVGGMTRAEAERALAPTVAGVLDRIVTIDVGPRSWDETTAALGTSVDVSGAVDRAFGVSGSLGWPARLWHRLLDRPVDRAISMPASHDRGAVLRFVRGIADQMQTMPVDASLDFADGHLIVRHARVGRVLPVGRATDAVLQAVRGTGQTVPLELRLVQPKLTDGKLGMTIIIRRSLNRLYLYDGLKLVKSYPVATGQLGVYDTPEGHWTIINKRINPTWYNPAKTTWGKDEPAIIPPGPDNPLGTRALDLSAAGIRIHGTPDDDSIGHWASHGCIRMHIPDSEELFGLVGIGTPVIIAW